MIRQPGIAVFHLVGEPLRQGLRGDPVGGKHQHTLDLQTTSITQDPKIAHEKLDLGRAQERVAGLVYQDVFVRPEVLRTEEF